MLNNKTLHGGEVYHESVDSSNDHNELVENDLRFLAFLKHTDQKSITAKKIGEIFDGYVLNHTGNKPLSILDIGCGEGEFLYLVTTVAKRLSLSLLVGMDVSEVFLRRAWQRFADGKYVKQFIQADCFNFDFSTLRKFNIALLSHVLYYCKDIKALLSTVLSALSDDGIMVLTHETKMSTPRQIREKFGADVLTDIPENVNAVCAELGVNVTEVDLVSHITFDGDLARLLVGLKTFSDVSSKLSKDDILLLEFMAQASLQSMESRGDLEFYLKDVQKICHDNQGRVPVISSIQIASRSVVSV